MRTRATPSHAEVLEPRSHRHRRKRSRWAWVAVAAALIALLAALTVSRGRARVEVDADRPHDRSGQLSPDDRPGMSPEHPWPIGTAGAVEGWRVKVIGITANASPAIAQVDGSVVAPKPGYQWLIVTLHVVRRSTTPRAPSLEMAWAYLGRSGRAYPSQPSALPDDLSRAGPLPDRGKVNGALAFEVASSEVGDGVLAIGFSSFPSVNTTTRFWSLSQIIAPGATP